MSFPSDSPSTDQVKTAVAIALNKNLRSYYRKWSVFQPAQCLICSHLTVSSLNYLSKGSLFFLLFFTPCAAVMRASWNYPSVRELLPQPPRPSSSVNVSEFRNDMRMRGDSSVRSSVSRMATGDERWQLVTAMSVTCSSLQWRGLAGACGWSWRICSPCLFSGTLHWRFYILGNPTQRNLTVWTLLSLYLAGVD